MNKVEGTRQAEKDEVDLRCCLFALIPARRRLYASRVDKDLKRSRHLKLYLISG